MDKWQKKGGGSVKLIFLQMNTGCIFHRIAMAVCYLISTAKLFQNPI